jgi:hypothetical protein
VNIVLIALAVLAVVMLIVGGAVAALKFLLWVGLVLLIVSGIAFLVRVFTGRRV